jgi:hypothetical protein
MYQNPLMSFKNISLLAASLAMVALPGAVRADDAAPAGDKSQYNLLSPTPADQMRPLSLDANDGVVDPTTVDAGHVQLQGDLVDYYHYSTTYRGGVNFTEDHFDWSPRLTLGLLNNVDLFVHPSFDETSYTYSGRYNASGDSGKYESINIGTKINLWGNDGGLTAFSVAPFVSIPSNGGSVVGGADISFAVRLPEQFYLKFVTDPHAFNEQSVYFGMENGMSLHKAFGAKIDTYAYLNTDWMSSGAEWYGYAGFGAGYQITRDLQIFAGIGFGLTSNSYDYNPRLGLGWRF